MFTRYGFGAKTSSGYGVADDLVFQKLWIRRMGGNNA